MFRLRIVPRRWAAAAVLLAGIGTAAIARTLLASDHQDTPEVELSPRSDINDVFVFPASLTNEEGIVLAMTTSSPLLPASTASARFDPALLYQFKVDNTGDGVEDLIIQVTFGDDTTVAGGSGQAVYVRGPAAPAGAMAPDGSPATPPLTGTATVQLRNVPVLAGVTGQAAGLSDGQGMRVFAGARDDPFYIDLEQFFRIIPDRKPVTGPLSQLPESPSAGGFRNPGIDLLSAIDANTLAIVVELPTARLTGSGNGALGVWATISR